MAATGITFESLPREIHALVQSSLPPVDVKSTRLASTACSRAYRLHCQRVYLSASSRDITVLRAIADSPSYRNDVEELVWDDARLVTKPRRFDPYSNDDDDDDSDDEAADGTCPGWFRRGCERSIQDLKDTPCRDGPLPQHVRKRTLLRAAWDLDQCWEFYKALLVDQEQVLQSGSDIEALRYALQHFPSLRTITITPTAHGKLFMPAYQTPKIRSFPENLIYPIPYAWPYCDPGNNQPEVQPWNGNDGIWSGYSKILQTLEDCKNNITDFIVDTHGFDTGINCYAVCDESSVQANLAKLCARQGFRRLDLALFVNGLEHDGFMPLRSGKLYSTLSAAKDIEHFHFSTSLEMDMSGEAAQLDEDDEDMDEHHLPLRSLFPVDTWSNLRFFGITKFLVLTSDLVDLLGVLPQSVARVELNFLMFLQRGTYGDLLEQMRQRLDWANRALDARPRVVISVPPDANDRPTLVVTVDNQVNAFLYQNGPNPFFSSDMGVMANYAEHGVGAVEWDWLDPEHRRPYADDETQQEQGYYGYMDWDE
ncbi:hypothetical protein VHEMI09065 [[Torrubiella] hemipterigena]|uniref:F-box domain-containing protein n=1 Tax=[Torrubiella] hemipterigena TaxID=1531966 RepID=A0A0A1TPC4_9HYPO|nr:hypothetical protein VHEMI09065 [[Torrubiella] hemipterigena]